MHYSKNVTLLGASRVKTKDIQEVLHHAPILVAADGGAKIAVKIGQMPEKVIGDFDSINKNTIKKIPKDRLHHVQDQNTTDFEKCLQAISAPLIIGIGFLDRRLDHQLASLNALVRNAHQRCVLISKRDVAFHVPQQLDIALEVGTRFSLFPMAPVTGKSAGLKWAIEDLSFAANSQIGTSNVTVAEQVSLTMNNAGMVAILPRKTLPRVLQALQPK